MRGMIKKRLSYLVNLVPKCRMKIALSGLEVGEEKEGLVFESLIGFQG